jgi:hypothetical protein
VTTTYLLHTVTLIIDLFATNDAKSKHTFYLCDAKDWLTYKFDNNYIFILLTVTLNFDSFSSCDAKIVFLYHVTLISLI